METFLFIPFTSTIVLDDITPIIPIVDYFLLKIEWEAEIATDEFLNYNMTSNPSWKSQGWGWEWLKKKERKGDSLVRHLELLEKR